MGDVVWLGTTRAAERVDLECAYERGILHLLQCRPLTTLAPA